MKRKIVLIIVSLLLLFSAFFIWKYLTREKPEEAKAPVFSEEIKDFRGWQNKVLLPDELKADIDDKEAIRKSYEEWQRIVKDFKYNPPPEYKKTRDWSGKIDEILSHEERALELAIINKEEDSRTELLAAQRIWREIRLENGLPDISTELNDMFAGLNRVATASSKEEAIKNLMDLKMKFTILKERSYGQPYEKNMIELEAAIGTVDKVLLGPDFRQAQHDLLELYRELFLEYN
jgi:hypothetical protein